MVTARVLFLSMFAVCLVQSESAMGQATDVICNKCVHGSDIAFDAITGNRIKNGSISNADIAPDAIGGNRIKNGSISAVDIAAGAITRQKIAPGAVSADKLSNDVFTEQPILGIFTGLATTTQFNCAFPQNNGQRGFDAIISFNRQAGDTFRGTATLSSASREITGTITGTVFPFGHLIGTFDWDTRDFGLLAFSSSGEFVMTVTGAGQVLSMQLKGSAFGGESCRFLSSIFVDLN